MMNKTAVTPPKPIASTALFEALARKDEVELLQDSLARIERETVGY